MIILLRGAAKHNEPVVHHHSGLCGPEVQLKPALTVIQAHQQRKACNGLGGRSSHHIMLMASTQSICQVCASLVIDSIPGWLNTRSLPLVHDRTDNTPKQRHFYYLLPGHHPFPPPACCVAMMCSASDSHLPRPCLTRRPCSRCSMSHAQTCLRRAHITPTGQLKTQQVKGVSTRRQASRVHDSSFNCRFCHGCVIKTSGRSQLHSGLALVVRTSYGPSTPHNHAAIQQHSQLTTAIELIRAGPRGVHCAGRALTAHAQSVCAPARTRTR